MNSDTDKINTLVPAFAFIPDYIVGNRLAFLATDKAWVVLHMNENICLSIGRRNETKAFSPKEITKLPILLARAAVAALIRGKKVIVGMLEASSRSCCRQGLLHPTTIMQGDAQVKPTSCKRCKVLHGHSFDFLL